MKKIFKTLGFVLLGLSIVGTLAFLWGKSRLKPIEYEVVLPERRTIEKKIIINGTIAPRNEVLIKPQISGIITALYKEAGQVVQVGDAVAKVKVIPDITQLNAAESRLNVANINFEQVKNEYERATILFNKGVMAKEEYDARTSAYKKAKEETDNARESLDIIKNGISSSTAQYSNTQVKSTIAGMILDVPVKVGYSVIQSNTFNDGTTIAVVANMNDLIFLGKVDETEVGRIAEGNAINLIIGAMQDAKCSAVLEYISPKGIMDNGATTFEIKAAVKNSSAGFIRSGYSSNGEIIVDKRDSVWSVPENCLEFAQDSAFVHVLQPQRDGKKCVYKRTYIELGLSDGVHVEVLGGIAPNDTLRGNVKLKTAGEKGK
ncbi:MAG: efflux RND transporter periplasmic adaptor subunit [Lentimicrobiaceae bacterium]|nr:efflux RND transporter periplasmic adaptor subunit [Lentimicrobiaceae bacterium]